MEWGHIRMLPARCNTNKWNTREFILFCSDSKGWYDDESSFHLNKYLFNLTFKASQVLRSYDILLNGMILHFIEPV